MTEPTIIEMIYDEVKKQGEKLETIYTWQLRQEGRVSKLEVRASLFGAVSGGIAGLAAFFTTFFFGQK